MDEDEIKETLEKPVTDEQKDTFNEALDKVSLPDNTTVGDDGQLYVPDDNGEQQPIEHPHQDIIDMTDEEAEEDYLQRMQELKDRINSNTTSTDVPDASDLPNDTDTSTPNTPNNDTPSTPNNDTPSQEQPTGAVWDQEFYDTLTDQQKEEYKNFDDESRIKMKQAVELVREWEKEGYQGIGSSVGELTGEKVEEGWKNIGNP